jgi:hypothetical protein
VIVRDAEVNVAGPLPILMTQLKEYGMDLRVIRGEPTPEEVAALVAVLVPRLRAAAAPAGPTARPSRWRASAGPASAQRPGPDAWRASALPR